MVDSENNAGKTKKSRPWGRLVLGLSLCLNLLFIGLVFGSHMSRKGSGERDRGFVGGDFSGGPYGRAIDKADRAALFMAFRDKMKGKPRIRREMREIGNELAELLRAEVFDRQAAANLLDRQRSIVSDAHIAGQVVLLDHFETLSKAKRVEIADRLSRMLKRGGRPK